MRHPFLGRRREEKDGEKFEKRTPGISSNRGFFRWLRKIPFTNGKICSSVVILYDGRVDEYEDTRKR
jgi:hypothetical protein